MSVILLSRKTVTARKSHRCVACRVVAITPGMQYVRETYVYDGMAYDWISCRACDAIHDLVWQWAYPEEGIDADDYAEWAEEHTEHSEHGEAARAYLDRIHSPQEEP